LAGTLLELENVTKYYPIRGGYLNRVVANIRAVDGVSLKVAEKTTYGIAGESGSGKSTLCMVVARLLSSTGGKLIFEGEEYTNAKGNDLKRLRAKIQMVFQNPLMSLDPHMTVKSIVLEPAKALGKYSSNEDELVSSLLTMVGLSPSVASRYPHELSGGMSQRVAIARAFSVSPKLIILDEPTSALDASVQAQVLNLFNRLQRDLGITYLLVSHDLSVIGHMCDRVAIMYSGRVSEEGTFEDVFYSPRHPYTEALLSSAHYLPSPEAEARFAPRGEMPSQRKPPPGCTYHPRCPFATDICKQDYPSLENDGGHRVACYHRAEASRALEA
jgi:oligopeptide/dipeptide ABC transporter ATP-binding protein